MASNGGGFFDRLANLWSGFWSLWIGGAERRNPEAIYLSAINGRVRQYSQLKKAVSNIIYLRNKLSAELDAKQKELREINTQIPVAVDEGEDEVALHLIERKDALTADVAGIQQELAKTSAEAEDAKQSLLAFQSEIEKLRKEKESMLAKQQNAQARIKIQETLSGLSTDADIKALDNVREHIGKLQAQADMGSELGDSSLDSKLRRIKAKASTSAARAQLDAIKRARAAQQQAAPLAKAI
jgi:phage shock protein A